MKAIETLGLIGFGLFLIVAVSMVLLDDRDHAAFCRDEPEHQVCKAVREKGGFWTDWKK